MKNNYITEEQLQQFYNARGDAIAAHYHSLQDQRKISTSSDVIYFPPITGPGGDALESITFDTKDIQNRKI